MNYEHKHFVLVMQLMCDACIGLKSIVPSHFVANIYRRRRTENVILQVYYF